MDLSTLELKKELLELDLAEFRVNLKNAKEEKDREKANKKLFEIEIAENKLKIINLDLQYIENEQDLGYKIARLKLEINGYKIEYQNATDSAEKKELRGLITSENTKLQSYLNQLQQLRNEMKPLESDSHQLSVHKSKSTTDFGIPDSLIIKLTAETTLEKFIQTLSGQECSNLNCNSEFFENARQDLQARGENTLREDELQSRYFPDLIKYGDNVLESTSNINNDFQKINFVSLNEKSKYPDLTLRISTPEDDLKGTLNDLTDWRLSPWAVIAYLELKRYNVNVSYHIHQALYYAQSTLLCCPTRDYCLTAVYNFKQIIFCGVKRVNKKLNYYISNVMVDLAASVEIAKFLSCPKSLLGYTDFDPFETYTPIAALGRGSTSLCVSVSDSNRNRFALKISPDESALNIEREILNYLHSENQNLPNYKPLNIPTVISRSSYLTVMSPVYSRSAGNLRCQDFEKAWDALREIHKFGISHRDVRIPNLGVYGSYRNKKFHWMDWSSAKPFQVIDTLKEIQQYPPGSTATASRPVLNRMLENINDYNCFPSDEGISMIYLVYQYLFGGGIPQPPEIALITWKNSMKLMPNEVIGAIVALENIAENYDAHYHEEIDKQVKKAINILFQKTNQNELNQLENKIENLNLYG